MSHPVMQGTDQIYSISAFIGYLLLISAIGIYTAKFSSSGVSQFYLAGRKLNRFVVALSAVVSGRSSWLLIGVTGMAYSRGASAVWAVVGYIVVEFFLFMFYAPRLRKFSEKHDCITLPDFFAARFNDKSGILRGILVIIIFLFLSSYVSAQFVGGGKAFAAGYNLDPTLGMFLTAFIVLIYTMLGGFLAVSLTDMLQAFFMLLSLVVLPIFAIFHLGGWNIVAETLRSLNPSFLDPAAITFGAMLGFVGIGLGSPGNPHILVRYMSIDDPKQLKWSAWIGTAWNVVMAVGALLIGMIGRASFGDVALLGGDTENLFPILASYHLHPILVGIIIASIFAAIMSTADSQLLVASSSIVVDFYEKILKKGDKLPEKKLVLYSRLSILFLVVLAILFGLFAEELVFWLVLFAWAGLGASIGPTSILALFWERTTRKGVIAGLITGTMTTIIWYNIPVLKGFIYELIPAFFLSLFVTIIVSLMDKKH